MMAGENVEARLARLEERLVHVGDQVVENRRASQAEHAKVQETLSEVLASLNKWAGVRAGLLGIGAFVAGAAGIAGAAAAWFFHKA